MVGNPYKTAPKRMRFTEWEAPQTFKNPNEPLGTFTYHQFDVNDSSKTRMSLLKASVINKPSLVARASSMVGVKPS
jgi:hypothetical protein